MVLKAVSALEAAHRSQVYNYLHTMYYALIRVICAICATKTTPNVLHLRSADHEKNGLQAFSSHNFA